MLKLLILIVGLISSPTFGLLENLYQTEAQCYSGCQNNYADKIIYQDACKKGCDYKFHNENCPEQCKSVSTDDQLQASCVAGCSMIDSSNLQGSENVISNDRPKSIILIRLRQRPSFSGDAIQNPVEMMREMIRQFQSDLINTVSSNDQEKTAESKTIVHLVKNIPLIRVGDEDRVISSHEEMINKIRNFFRQRYEQPETMNNRFQQLMSDARREWNDLIGKQPNIPVWILLTLFFVVSAIFWYMIVSLCSHAPSHRIISIRAQELAFDNNYEKEKLQFDDDIIESTPVKTKLATV